MASVIPRETDYLQINSAIEHRMKYNLTQEQFLHLLYQIVLGFYETYNNVSWYSRGIDYNSTVVVCNINLREFISSMYILNFEKISFLTIRFSNLLGFKPQPHVIFQVVE